MGLLDRLLGGGAAQAGQPSWLNRNSDTMTQFGLGLLSGRTGQEQAALGAQGLASGMQTNRTVKWLETNSPELAQAVRSGAMTAGDAAKLAFVQKAEAEKAKLPQRQWVQLPDGKFGWADKTTGSFLPIGTAAKPQTDSRPALIQEFEYAKSNGFEGGIADYARSKTAAGGVGGGAKAPSGYRWTDETESSLEPIPGGPGEEIPGELAARLGMSKSFLEKAPDLRKKLANGDVTGWWDQRFALNGIGDRGQIYQELQSGTDALMRLLTGAGMNESEARAYSERYLPTGRDTAEEAVSKLDRLTRELEATAQEAGKGRGGFKFGGGASNGSTSNRIRWSVK